MLRIGFLPSDFHPMMLILGEAADLDSLARRLREFSESGSDFVLDGGQRSLTAVTLSRIGEAGMRAAGNGTFVWCLDADHAVAFADTLETLGQPDMLSGSEHLETGAAGEIPVKVSRGEYTNDFLVDDRAGAPL